LEEYYSAAQYEHDALQLITELFKQHNTLILTGGSMMYVDAVTQGIDDIPTVDSDTRSLLQARYKEEGLTPLAAELKLLDPTYYAICDTRNPKRIIHALEICYITGKPFSSFLTGRKAERPFKIEKIGLIRERKALYERINHRVTQMLDAGLLEEVRRVAPFRHCNALNTVG